MSGTTKEQVAAAKVALRRQVRARRRARDPAQRAVVAAGLRDVVLASGVLTGVTSAACYASAGTEPGTGPLRAALAQAGLTVLLPVVTGGLRLDWAVDVGELVPGPLGTSHPPGRRLGPAALADVDVVLIPALAVDTRGRRLGQGGGYYDATLPIAGSARLVALVHDDELLDAGTHPVPTGPADHRVTDAATPSRWVELGP